MGNASFKLNLTIEKNSLLSSFILEPYLELDQASLKELNMILSNKDLEFNKWLQAMNAKDYADLVYSISEETIVIFKNDAGWSAQGSTSSIPNYAEAVKLLKDDLKNLK